MANQLKMALVHTILSLHGLGWSNRRIARELSIDRGSVSRHVQLAGAEAKPATNLPTGSPPADGSADPASNLPAGLLLPGGPAKPATNPPAGSPGPSSHCEQHRELIQGKLQQGLSAQRIWQDLIRENGFGSSYDSVKRFVRRLGATELLPFRRMECEPGAEAQVDFGTGAPVIEADHRRGTHVLRVVLSHSRKGYSEVVFRQTTEDFLAALENAFWHFGGVPRTIIIDNLKAAVAHADWYDPQLNPRVQAFCEHYGTVILPAKPYTPRHKGKVERGVAYVQANALKGRRFCSLQEQNRHLAEWEATVADTRIHGTTRRQVGKVFTEVEKPALLPLPAGRFPFFREEQRSVHRDGHIEVAKAYYSVPPEYVTRRVWVRWDGHLVRIFNQRMEPIAVHAQQQAGRFSTQDQHIVSEKISAVEHGATRLLRQVGRIGPQTDRWAQAMLAQRGIAGVRVLVGLQAMGQRHPVEQLEHACEVALTHQAFRLRDLRGLLRHDGGKQEAFEFLAEHPIIRNLGDYGQLVRAAWGGEPVALQPT